MTLRTRNVFYSFFFLLAVTALGFFSVLLFMMPRDESLILPLIETARGIYFGLVWPITTMEAFNVVLSVGLSLIMASGIAAVFLYYFRKLNSPVIFFLSLFAMSLVFESSKFWALYLGLTSIPGSIVLVLSRVHAFGLFLGSLSILAASFHLAGLASRYQMTMVLASLGFSAALANYLPLDGSHLTQGFLWGTSYVPVELIMAILGAISMLNVIKYSREKENGGSTNVIAQFALLVLGQQLLQMGYNLVVLLIAWLMLIGAMIFLTRRFIRTFWY